MVIEGTTKKLSSRIERLEQKFERLPRYPGVEINGNPLLFCDAFELELARWDEIEGEPRISSTISHHGGNSLEIDANLESCRKGISREHLFSYVAFYSQNLTRVRAAGANCLLMAIMDPDDLPLLGVGIQTASDLSYTRFQIFYLHNDEVLTALTDVDVTDNAWYILKIEYQRGEDLCQRLWINGILKNEVIVRNQTKIPSYLFLGWKDWTAQMSGPLKVYFDCLGVKDKDITEDPSDACL